MPFHGVTSEARHFEAEYDADPTHAYFGHQPLKALAVAVGSGSAEIGVNHGNGLGRPSQSGGVLPQGVLSAGAFGVLDHLAWRRLSHIQACGSKQMIVIYLVMGVIHEHVLCR